MKRRRRSATTAAATAGEACGKSADVDAEKPNGRGTKADVADAADTEAVETPPASAKRSRKPKPEGPYTKYKDAGEPIPEFEGTRLVPLAPAESALPGANNATAELRVAAWNLGGLRGFLRGRGDDLPELVRRERPDVLGLFEHKLQQDGKDTEEALSNLRKALPDYDIAAVNYSTAKKGYSGVVVLVRKDALLRPLDSTVGDLPSAANEGRLVTVEFEALFIVFAYVPNSGEGLKRLQERIDGWDVQLRERLNALAARKAVALVGDLNVAHLDLDIWNGEAPHIAKSAGTTPQERESFGRLLTSGFVDGFRHFHRDAQGAFTYWSVRAGNRPKNRGLRLDYVVVSKDMVAELDGRDASLVDAFHVPSMSTGDHCPFGAVLRLRKASDAGTGASEADATQAKAPEPKEPSEANPEAPGADANEAKAVAVEPACAKA